MESINELTFTLTETKRKKRILDVEAGYSIKECASRWVLSMGQFITGYQVTV